MKNENIASAKNPVPALVDMIRPRQAGAVSLKSGINRTGRISFASDAYRGHRFRVRLYRFMADSIPLINSVIWTWSRLAAAPGRFQFFRNEKAVDDMQARTILDDLFRRLARSNFGHGGSEADLLPPFFQSLFLDGSIAGRMSLREDLGGVDYFKFFDLARTEIRLSKAGEVIAAVSNEAGERTYSGDDIFYYAFNADLADCQGRSILTAVPFVSFVEQQLVDDMQRSMHNAGYHRLHVKIAPPEKRESESDESYMTRANNYFDDTVSMIKNIEPEDNPVTWQDVAIEYIGPRTQGGSKTTSWYINHRAMVEEVCSGTNLAPFLLGYSYNATTNWAQFKYDLVMRQVATVQNAAVTFLNWLANIELALRGFDLEARWEFSNDFSVLAGEQAEVKSREAERVIDLFKAGLIDKDTASRAAARLV
ncbi:MAG: hypothetical protein GY841_05925 [FCB group bacterium]|nr:hypothetical protein [FCB group bacterium]